MANDQIESLLKALKLSFKGVEDRNFTRELLSDLREDIQRRVRLGFGVEDLGKPRKKLKRLSSSYVQQRTRDRAKGKLSSKTTPSRSNLTRTGELIDSLTERVTGDGKGEIIFRPGQRKDGSGLTNARVANFVEKERKFFNATNREVERLTDKVKKKYLDSLRSQLRKL